MRSLLSLIADSESFLRLGVFRLLSTGEVLWFLGFRDFLLLETCIRSLDELSLNSGCESLISISYVRVSFLLLTEFLVVRSRLHFALSASFFGVTVEMGRWIGVLCRT